MGSVKYATQYFVKNNGQAQRRRYKSCYCVIVYVGYFWPPDFGLISVQPLPYTPKSLLFIPIYFLRLPLSVVSVRGHGEHVRGA